MKNILMAATLLAASQAFTASEANAAQCADRGYVVSQLESRFGETLLGVTGPRRQAVLEVYGSRQTETWTVMVSFQKGLSCIVASGNGFSNMAAAYRPTIVLAGR